MESKKPDPNLLIQAIASGDRNALKRVYQTYRDEFIGWAGYRYPGARHRDILLDAWHETIIMFKEAIDTGRLTHLTCELRTYLFLLGSRWLQKTHHLERRTDLRDEWDANIEADERINMIEWEMLNEENHAMLKEAIENLPPKSRQALVMRYLEGRAIHDIRSALEYESENAVSVTISRAVSMLRNNIHKKTGSS